MRPAKITFVSVFALLVVAYSVIQYGFFDPRLAGLVKVKLQNPDFHVTPWVYFLYVHIVTASLALLLGPVQMFMRHNSSGRKKLHRSLGKLYVVSVFLSSFVNLYLSLAASGGWVAKTGFFILDLLWMITTYKAVAWIVRGNIQAHREWMLRSYAVTFSAVTLRLMQVPLMIIFGEFEPVYKFVAWACWIVNLLVAELIIRRNRRSRGKRKTTNRSKPTASAKQRNGLIIFSMALGLLLSSLDNTIVSASIAKVIEDIHGFDKVAWVFTAYMLASTSTMLIFGKMSDLFGRKRFYLIGIVLFLLGSALCGAATSINGLIWFRIVQGIGSGAIFPISFTILYTMYADPKHAAKLSGVMGAVFGLSSVVGPLLGTWISEHIGWRWCFYINLPLGIASFLILMFALHESRSDHKPRIDYPGTLLLVSTIAAILLGLEFGGKTFAWNSWPIIGMFGAGIAGMIAFIAVERRAEEPILPLHIFQSRMVTGTSVVCFCQGVIMFSAISYLPLYSVIVLGRANSNGILTPMMLSLIIGAIAFSALLSKLAFRTVMALSMASGVMAALLLIHLSHDLRSLYMTLLMVLLGFGAIGPMMSVGQNAMAASVDPRFIGVSSSIVGFWRNIGGVMGASIMAVLVNRSLLDQITRGAAEYGLSAEQTADLSKSENLLHLQNLSPQLGEFVRNALGTAINNGFIVSAVVLVVGLAAALCVGPSRMEGKPKGETAAIEG